MPRCTNPYQPAQSSGPTFPCLSTSFLDLHKAGSGAAIQIGTSWKVCDTLIRAMCPSHSKQCRISLVSIVSTSHHRSLSTLLKRCMCTRYWASAQYCVHVHIYDGSCGVFSKSLLSHTQLSLLYCSTGITQAPYTLHLVFTNKMVSLKLVASMPQRAWMHLLFSC